MLRKLTFLKTKSKREGIDLLEAYDMLRKERR
jgi:hypothetical protein